MDRGADSYQRYLNGDDEGLADIVRLYADGLTFYLNRFVNDLTVAEDLMEETFFKIITKKPRFHSKYTFKTWLYTIGRNVVIDHLRRNKYVGTSIEAVESQCAERDNPENAYIAEERKKRVHEALMHLPSDYRQVLWLLYFEGFTHKETAVIMKKTSKQMKNLVYRAKTALKQALEKEGFTYEDI